MKDKKLYATVEIDRAAIEEAKKDPNRFVNVANALVGQRLEDLYEEWLKDEMECNNRLQRQLNNTWLWAGTFWVPVGIVIMYVIELLCG